METKLALITGGSRGIGRELCLKFAQKGYDIAFCYRANDEKAQEVESEVIKLGVSCLKYKCDVRILSEVSEMVRDIFEKKQTINVLVNNAGILKVGAFAGMQKQDWEDMFETNLYGAFNLSKTCIPYLMKKKGNSIINVSSFMAIRPLGPAQAIYAASKAALIGFTRTLSKELAPAGIRVNVVAPGLIDTDMLKPIDEKTLKTMVVNTTSKRLGTPKEIADSIVYLTSDEAQFINGQTIVIDGGGVTYQF